MWIDDHLHDLWAYLSMEWCDTGGDFPSPSVLLYALVLLQEWNVLQNTFLEE